MRIRPLLLLFSVLTSFSYAQTSQALKENIKKLLHEQKLTGAIWATVSADGEIITDAYGYKNTQTKALLSSSDKVHVGSVSKAVVAAGFLRMATLGLINLDDPVQKYLPKLPLENHWKNTNPLLLRHLLDHTSGLIDVKLWHVFSTTATPNTPLENVYRDNPELLKVQTKPGAIYSYSNLGYSLLGLIIEKVTNQRYEDYLDKNLLKPLGMTRSTFHFVSQTGKQSDQQLAYGHFDNGKPVAAMPMYLRPAGQFTTTAQDLGKFLRFMMSDGTLQGKPFINNKYLKAIGQQKGTEAYKNGVPYGDALGAYSRDRYGVVGIAKNGNTLGFSAMIYQFPAEQKAFFIAFNTDSETADYDLFNRVLVDHLHLTPRPFITTEKNIENEIKHWDGYYIPVIEKVPPFGLLDYLFSHTRVETFNTTALLSPFQGKSTELIYQGNKTFSMKDRTAVSHSFYKAVDHELLITNGVNTMRKVSGLTILGIAASISLGLLGMVYLFILGCINIVRHKFEYVKQPSFLTFLSVLLLIISSILMLHQSFLFLGDKTFANYFMACSTALVPLFSAISFLLIITKQRKYIQTCTFWAILNVLQFSVVLVTHHIFPLMLWK